MPQTLYCWRCQMDIPMLTDEEWALVGPHLNLKGSLEQIKRYQEEHQCSLAEAIEKGSRHKALEVYAELTGFQETNANALYHHLLSLYGPPCKACGKPLRTPQARHCAACGTTRD